jgi:hypothetical protein
MKTSRYTTLKTQTRFSPFLRLTKSRGYEGRGSAKQRRSLVSARCQDLITNQIADARYMCSLRSRRRKIGRALSGQITARELWPVSIWLTRSARCCVNSRLGRDHIKARLVIRQSSTPARGTVVPVNDEYNVIASDNERVQR